MSDLWSRYQSFLPIIGGTLFFALFGLLFYLHSRKAMASNRGGLAWIRSYGKPGFSFELQALTSYHKDWLCVFGAGVFSLLVSILYGLFRSRYETGSWFDSNALSEALRRIPLALGGTVAAYFLLQDLFDDNLLSTCGALLFTAARLRQHSIHCLLLAALVFLLRYLLTDEEAPLFPRELLYWASVVLVCLAAFYSGRLLWLGLPWAGIHIYLCIRKSLAAGTPGKALAGIGLGLVWWLLGLLLLGMTKGLFFYGRSLPALLTTPFLFKILRGILHSMIAPLPAPARSRLLPAMIDAPLFVLGLLGLLRSLKGVQERHDPRGLFILCVNGALLLLWLLFGIYALLPGLLLSVGFVWDSFTQSRKKAPVTGCAVLFILYYVCLLTAGYLIPLTDAILERIV